MVVKLIRCIIYSPLWVFCTAAKLAEKHTQLTQEGARCQTHTNTHTHSVTQQGTVSKHANITSLPTHKL